MDENNQNPYAEQNQENWETANKKANKDDNKKIKKGFGIASMVLGICAYVVKDYGLLLALLAIVFGSIQIKVYGKSKMAIAGIVMGVLLLAFVIIAVFFLAIVFGYMIYHNL